MLVAAYTAHLHLYPFTNNDLACQLCLLKETMDQRQGSIFASLSSRAEQGAALLDIPWQKMSTKSSSALFPQRHMPRRLITVCGLIAVVIIMTFFGFSDRRVAPYGLPSSLGGGRAPGTLKGPTPAMDQLLRTMYRPNIMSVTEPSFTDENGTVYSITGQPEFKKSLGKKLLILDVDTRNMSAKGRMLDEEGVQWPGVQPMTAGILSHYLYCKSRPTHPVSAPCPRTWR